MIVMVAARQKKPAQRTPQRKQAGEHFLIFQDKRKQDLGLALVIKRTFAKFNYQSKEELTLS